MDYLVTHCFLHLAHGVRDWNMTVCAVNMGVSKDPEPGAAGRVRNCRGIGAIISTELFNDFKARAANFKSSIPAWAARIRNPSEPGSRHMLPDEE